MVQGRNSNARRKGRGGRRPFKSRNNTSSFRRAMLKKRKHEIDSESEEETKRFKEDPAEDSVSSTSSESEEEEVNSKADSHTLLLQSFGADVAPHSEPEEDESDDSTAEIDSDTPTDEDEVFDASELNEYASNKSNSRRLQASQDIESDEQDENFDVQENNESDVQEDDESDVQEDDESDVQEDDESDVQEDDESDVQEDDKFDVQEDDGSESIESDIDSKSNDNSSNQIDGLVNNSKKRQDVENDASLESDVDSLFCGSDDEQAEENNKSIVIKTGKTEKKKKSKKTVLIDDLNEADHRCLPEQNDPFCTHFERNLSEEAAERLLDSTSWQTECRHWPALGGAVKYCYPTPPTRPKNKPKLRLNTDSDAVLPTYGGPLHLPSGSPDLSTLSIKETVLKNVGDLTDQQKYLLQIISNYTDLYLPTCTHDKWDDITKVYSIHMLNHVLKTRARILKNNSKLNKLRASKSDVDMALFKDQGLSRPKVLVLLPSKHSAYRVVKAMQSLLGLAHKQQVKQLGRFEDDYGPGDTEGNLPRALKGRPDDFVATFTGDTSENFKIGITVSSRSLGLYANFARSDIILTSPLGLRLTAGVEGEEGNNTGFLSSVELLILDQASCFLMQNWDHVLAVLESINVFVKNVRDIVSDGRRVRPWVVDGHGKLYRQTLMFSSTLDDLQRALFSRCCNLAGRLEVLPPCEGVLKDVFVSADLMMLRCPGMTDGEARLNYFTQEFFPQHVASRKAFTLLYIPDTSDYYLLSQFLAQERAIDFSSINEYLTSKMSHAAVARSDFFKGKSPLLLYTERFHYYKRPVIKGVRHLIFYALPSFPRFFSEMCNLMMGSLQNQAAPRSQRQLRSSITVLYQRSDVTRLASIMGSATAKELLSSNKAVHMCSISST